MTGRELLNCLMQLPTSDLDKPVTLSLIYEGAKNYDCEYLNVDEESILLADEEGEIEGEDEENIFLDEDEIES